MADLKSFVSGASSSLSRARKTIPQPSVTPQPVISRPVAIPMSSYQQTNQKWYAGESPTYRETLGRIVQIAGNDVSKGNQMMQSLNAMTQDPSTPFYKQYAQPTNPAVGNLQSLGFDTSNLTAEWIDANRDWIGANLITSDTTGAPTKPGKKATWAQNVAYQLYQWNMAEGLTQQAEKEREDAIAEAKYWAGRTDLNLSDDGVIGKVREGFSTKYPTLAKLESRDQFKPIEINRGVDFSDDDLYAGAWEGRNPDYNGNIQGAMVQSYLGKGNVWKDNADIDAKLDWKNQDTYSRYSVGMTLEEEGVYFNAPKFTRETVEAIRQDLDLTDKNEVKMFNNVVSALNFTEQAQYEQKLFMDTLNKKLEGVKTEEEARRIVERLYNNGVVDKATKQTVNFGNLKKMDESLKGTSLINTTDAIDWKYDDVIKYAVNVAHDNENRKTTHDVQADLASPGTGIGVSVQAVKADIEQRFAEAQNLLGDSATPAEEKALTYTGSSGYDSLRNVFEIYNPANLMSKVMGSITTGNVENALDTYQGYSAYQQAEARLPYVQAEIADLESRVNANDKEIEKLNYFRDMLQAAENGTLDSFGVFNIKQYSKIANAVSALEAGETQYQAKDGTHEYLMDIYETISGDDNRYPTADEHIAARRQAQEWLEYLTSDKVATGSMPEGGNERLRNLYKDERSLQDQLEANKESHAEYARASQANRTMLGLSKFMGLDTRDLEASIAIGDYLNYFTEYHGTKWESYNAYDTMMQGLGAGATYEDVKEAAAEGNAKVLEALEDLNFVREYTAEKGVQLPAIVEQGLEREEARLNRVLKDYEYFTKQEAANFTELAAQGKELEESQKPTTRPGNVAEYELLAPTDYGLINASFYGMMTEEEKNTYYYLYASEGAKAAEEYYMYLADPTYGVLQTRYAESVREGAKAEVDSGFVGGAWANVKAILSAPLDFAGSLSYMIYSGVTGEEFNPNNSALSYGKYAKAVNQATAESIQETFKDNPVAQTVLGGLYEMVYNRGRSMVNGLMTGGFTSMIGNGILQELAGAAPMAVSAMADAIAEAKDRGAEDWQAWLIGAATFFAEDFTEGITYGNIRDTITGSPDEVVVGFKNLMKNWLLNSGVEEMFGEGFNDWFENQADQMIMGELSEHAERVARIKADNEGITDAEAEAMARREELEGLAHTMVISYLGAGLDVPVSTMKSFLYEQSYARQKAKEERANGGTRSISEIRKEFHAQRMAGEVPSETQNAPQEQPTETAPATTEAVPEETDAVKVADATPATTEAAQEETDAVKVAKGVAKISAVRGADTASNTAAVASALGGEVGTIEGDTATAAATGLAEIMNGNPATAAKTVKNIMLGALDANVPVASVQEAIKTAGLSASSQARGVMTSENFAMATGAQQAAMLAETISIDVQNPVVQQEAETAIHESRVAEAEKVLIANGALNGTKAAMQARDDASAKLANAREELNKKTAETLAKSNAFEQATQEMAQNPTADNQKNLDRALNELNGAVTAEEQYNDSVDSMQSELDKAQSNLNEVRDQEASAIRQQAEDAVTQIDQQRAEAAAQQAEQQRIAAEQQAQAQAEEDERSGKAWEDKRDGLIEDLLNQEHLEGEERDARREELLKRADQIKLGKIDMTGMVNNAEGFLAVSAFGRKLGIGFHLSDNLPDNARGMYENGVVYLNNNLIKKGKLTVGQALVEASLHEITHSMENTKNYKTYRQVVLDALFTNEDGVFDQAAYDAAIDQKIADYRRSVNQELSREKADAEIVADFARTHLNGRDVVKRFMDAGLGGKMRNTLHNINQAIKNFRLQGEEKVTAEYLRRAERAFQKAMDEVARTAVHPDGGQFSVAQIAQATEMRFDEETRKLYDKNGNEIDGVNNKITADMIGMTPVGLLIRNGLSDQSTVDENGNAKPSQQAAAMEMMAGLMNMVARYKDSNLVWEIGSATLSSTFSALKSNSDPQYATTVDFGTVCAKTQAIIDVMSQVMLDRVKNGKYGGLTREEIMKVYNETHKAGLSVPCPVCYVFSRWMGVPSLLGQMSTYQHDYVVTKKDADGNTILNKNGDAVIDVDATQAKVNEYIKNAEAKYGDAKAINNRKTQLQNQQAKLQEQRLSVTNKEEDMALLTKMTELDKQIGEVSAYNWVTQALCKKDKNGNYVVDEKFRLTPDEILFDLNRTGEFAGYEKNWRYRNTRGAGMGKAIMPYSGETIGDILYGVKAQGRQIKNPWLNKDEKAAVRQLKQARERAKKQNLVGGQRLQSTSDFRPEWGLDYLMSFLELQAAGSKVQMYTKVAEAVDFFASVGADVNLSIMAKNNGFHEASAEEIAGMTDEQREAATVDGKIYVMDFSNITGMDYGQATALKNKYDSVQMILVGMNDTHIRLALKNSDIDFVIPWHSSGNSKDILSGLISSVGERLNSSVDYTTTQTDMVKGTVKRYKNENGETVEYTVPGKQTKKQKELWDARVKLLTKGDNALTKEDRKALLSNPYTAKLYERFTKKGVDPDCYGVKLNKSQATQIFPYEYWDTSSTKDNADVNGKRFVEYCEAMGIVPRFSQFKDDPGYWKLLIDRPMYNNDKSYHQQKVIDVTNARIGELNDSGNLVNSDLPSSAQAKYAPKDPRNENYQKYTQAEKQAIENAEVTLGDKPYNDGTTGQLSVFGETTDADLEQMLSDASQDYEDAVARGDMEAAAEDVDFYAEQAGYVYKVFHGTPTGGFTEFDLSKLNFGRQLGDGIYFTDSREVAENYESATERTQGEINPMVYEGYFNPGDNPLVIDMNELRAEHPKSPSLVNYLLKEAISKDGQNASSIVIKGIYDGSSVESTVFIAKESKQFKTSEPVTYDNSGNIIPLDQRFSDSADMRYSSGGELTMADIDQAIDDISLDELQSLLGIDFDSEEEARNVMTVAVQDIKDEFDPTIYNGRLYVKPDTLDYWLSSGGFASSNPNYAQAYITTMNPSDFLRMTTVTEQGQNRILNEATPLDEEKIGETAKRQPIQLNIDEASGRVIGHEGRHRAVALARAGVTEMPVLLFDSSTKYSKTAKDQMTLLGQSHGDNENGNELTFTDVIPLSSGNREAITQRFVATDAERNDAEQNQQRILQYSSGGENTLSDIDNQLITTGVVTEDDLAEYNNLPGIPATDNGGAQRQFGHQTAQQGSALHDEVKEYLYTHSSYTPDTNDAQVDRAIGWVQQHASTSDPEGYFSAMQEAESADFDYRSADGQARMLTLMGMAALKGDTASELRLADAFNKQGTDLGRMLQARKLFRLMTPLGRVSVLQQEANRINEQYAKDGRNTRVALSEWTMKAAEAAETEEDFDNVRKAAAGELAEQMPANWKDKLTGWRMLAMLGNPRTHIRNVLGNFLFMPAVGIKNKIGALAELGLAKENRTKTIGLATQDARAFAKDYANAIKDELTGEAKYNDGNLVQQQRKTWGTGKGILSRTGGRLLQGLSDFNGNMLEAEDWIFLNRHFRNALAGYMTARGLTSKDMTGKVLEDAQTYAIQEAQKATYRDANKLASTLSKIGREGGLTGFVVNAVLPFKKTPANILKRGIEYSPVGIVKALTSDAKHLKEYMDYQNGKLKALPERAISPSQWIDKVASGLTGSGIMALGFLLSSIGAVKAGLDDDDEFDKLRGEQDYSMNPGKVGNEILQLFGAPRIFGEDVSMTIDWAAPMSMPLFVGATLYNAIERLSEGDEIDVGAVADSILNITEPVFNLSMLDGVNSLLDVNTYGEANALTAIGEKVLTNYATSFVPTLLGQAARTIDTTRRKAFVPSGASLQTPRYALEQTENKVPFLSKTNIPYRNAWGDTSTKETLAAGLENFLSPAYINPIKDDAVTDELERLYNTVSDNNKGALTPKMPNKKLNNEALNAEQYDQLTVERGQTAHQVLTDLMQTAEYAMADDETRAGMVADVWTYSTQRANYIVSGGKTKKDKWVSEAENGDPAAAVLQRAVDRNKNEQATGFTNSLKESLANGDLETAQIAIAGMRRADKTDAGIKTTVTNVLKPIYQKAYLADDDETMFEIETMLDNLDDEIQWKYGDWLKNLDDVEEEETGLDTKWLNMNN